MMIEVYTITSKKQGIQVPLPFSEGEPGSLGYIFQTSTIHGFGICTLRPNLILYMGIEVNPVRSSVNVESLDLL